MLLIVCYNYQISMHMKEGKPMDGHMRVFFPTDMPESLQFVVIAARHKGKWVFVRQVERLKTYKKYKINQNY